MIPPPAPATFRGVFFNPYVQHDHMAGYPWPVFDKYHGEYRRDLQTALADLVRDAHVNLIALFIPIPFTLANPPQAPRADQPISEWANLTYLDNLALFIDDCHDAGVSLELDLVDNRWIPYRIDSERHIGRPGNTVWPVADDTPWDESATWYREVINYIESRAQHPESIAMWCMMGHYQCGTAEPCLWDNDSNPAILASTRDFVKHVWPVFRAAGKRPKAAPILLPIFSNVPYWMSKSPEERLSAFRNLKQWIVDDLALPPDYWLMTLYPYCDPAPDGFHYLRRIVEILGREQASRMLVTDLKGPGHASELQESIISDGGHSGREMLEWHFQKCAEYGLAGWWIYSYQDQEALTQRTGLRSLDGSWKSDLLPLIQQQSQAAARQ
ncbi:MAG: hypothetical protein ACYC3X_05545 [Pirellulaceae bacterium]